VLEPLSAYLLLAARLRADPTRYSGSWNFGPSSADVRTVEDVANAISRGLGRECAEVVTAAPGQHEAQLLQLNCDKAHQLLGWRPRWSVEKTLSATAEWYAAVVKSGAAAEDVTRRQLHDYFPELA
jgi:CDP-glucose 4,6-dehydratase